MLLHFQAENRPKMPVDDKASPLLFATVPTVPTVPAVPPAQQAEGT